MTAPDRVAAVLLAAGRSERFGAQDKLLADLDGRPLVMHTADLLRQMGFAACIAVCGPHVAPVLDGFEIVINQRPEEGQAASLRMGVDHALAHDVDAVLIALGDMPFITADHLCRLLRAEGQIRASTSGDRPMPPVLFDRAEAVRLSAIAGDQGARALLNDASLVVADAAVLRDIDLLADLTDMSSSEGD